MLQRRNELTPREAATRLGVRLDSLYAMLWAGRLPGRRQEGRWFIPATAVEARLRAKENVHGTTRG